MYGKSLDDFPDRFTVFHKAVQDIPVEDLDLAFEDCSNTCGEFPVPAQIREAAKGIRKRRELEAYELRAQEDRRRDDAIKAQRFLEAGPSPEWANPPAPTNDERAQQEAVKHAESERRRVEFWQMVRESKANRMPS